MKNTQKTVKNASFIIMLAFLPLFHTSASSTSNPITEYQKEYDSMYTYHALENKVSFPDVGAVALNWEEKSNTQEEQKVSDVNADIQYILERQDFSFMQIDNAIKNILENENNLKTFFVGNDLGVLKFQLVQIKDYLTEFNGLSSLHTDTESTLTIDNHVTLLKEKQVEVENFIHERENKFSLFGWLVEIL